MTGPTANTIEHVIQARAPDISGLDVARALPHAELRTAGPFFFFDHMRSAEFDPNEGADVRTHLHNHTTTINYSRERINLDKAGCEESRFSKNAGDDEVIPLPEK